MRDDDSPSAKLGTEGALRPEDHPYGADSIEVLSGLQAIRKRPSMYVGDTEDGSGLHHLVWELVANAVDEHLAGHASRLDVRIDGATVCVDDDGRGIPSEAFEPLLTYLHSGATLDGHRPHVHVGSWSYAVGLPCVFALAEEFQIESHRFGERFRARGRRGELIEPATRVGGTHRRGTRITFTPDRSIFASVAFDRRTVEERLRSLSWLNPALTVRLDHDGDAVTLRSPRGLVHALDEEAEGPPTHPIVVRGAREDVEIALVLWFRADARGRVRAFVNQQEADQGTHVEGFWDAMHVLTRRAGITARPAMVRETLSPHLDLALSVALLDPTFGAPTRSWLTNPEVRRAVRALALERLDPCEGRWPLPWVEALRARFPQPSAR